ncbi:MAG: HD domain-containing phosphohydrolase [Chloroflexia bacterium]
MIKQQSADGSPLHMPTNADRRNNSLYPRSIFSNDILLYTSATPAVRSLVVTPTQAGSRRDTFFKLSMHEWLRLMLAIVVTITSLGFLLLAPFLTGKPPDLGFTIATNPAGRPVVQRVVPNGMAYNLGVRPGDPVLSYWNLGAADTASTIALDGGNGQAVEVSTKGVTGLTPLQKFSYLFLSLIFIAVGGPVYVKARQRSAASAFYLFCIASAICLTTGTVLSLKYPWLLATMFVGISVWASAFAIFFLKFPMKVGKTVRQHKLMVGSILLCGFATVTLYTATFFDADLYPVAQLTNSVYLAMCTVVGLGSLVRAFFIQRSKLVQNQLSVLVIGTVLAVCPTLLLVIVPGFLGMAGLEVEFTALSLGIMPLALAYAITQHQLLGIRGLVRRGVTYVMMGFVVLMIFSLGALSLGAFLPEGWYHGDFGLLAVSAFVFMMALSYGYIQRTVETWVDKFIYHDGYDYKEALLEFSSQLATEQDLDRLNTNLVERTCNLMNLTCGVLLLADHPEDGPAARESALGEVLAGEDGEEGGRQIPKDMRVTPYARFGQGADWLIEGLQKELAGHGIHLVGNAPTQLMYFNNGTQPMPGHDQANFNSGPLYDYDDPQTGPPTIAAYGGQPDPSNQKREQPSKFDGDARQPQRAGATTMRSFLGVPLWTRQRFVGMLCLGNKRTGEHFTKDDLALLGTLSTQASLAIYNAQLFEAQREALLGTIEALAHAIEAKDGYTIKHCERMTERATALAQAMCLPDHDIENIRLAAILHDIGKIGIPDSILNKPGRLTPEEYETMKEHPVIGARIVQSVGALTGVVSIVKHHHERYDGSGYPERLKGIDIPLGARIIGVVDTYGAMTEDRVYRPAPGHRKAVEELTNLSGKQFDPEIVLAFLRLLEVRPDLAELSHSLTPSTRLL